MREYLLVSSLPVLLVIISAGPQVSGQDTSCGAGLQCVSAGSCPSFIKDRGTLDTLRRGSQERARLLQKLRSLVCNKKKRKVCCQVVAPPPPPPTPSPSPTPSPTDHDSPSYLPSLEDDQCGMEGGGAAFVLGGEDTAIGEFPFLVLLGKVKRKGENIKWSCGGSIINKWFILSAAHCGPKVDYVRLGEWKVVDPKCEDLDDCERECDGECEQANQKIDCETVGGVETCTEPYQDIPVAEVKVHPDYKRTRSGLAKNDTMLLKLSRPAVFNTFVQPACLPSPSLGQFGELEASKFGNNLPTVVGWGRTTSRRSQGPVDSAPTDIQQKLKMPARDNRDCIAQWQKLFKIDLTGELSPSLHLCAG